MPTSRPVRHIQPPPLPPSTVFIPKDMIPLGGPPLWRAVVERQNGYCACDGVCGKRHRERVQSGYSCLRHGVKHAAGDGHCPDNVGSRKRLHVVKASNVLEVATDPHYCVAYCAGCLDALLRVARRPERAARRTQDGPDLLGELLDLDEIPADRPLPEELS